MYRLPFGIVVVVYGNELFKSKCPLAMSHDVQKIKNQFQYEKLFNNVTVIGGPPKITRKSPNFKRFKGH